MDMGLSQMNFCLLRGYKYSLYLLYSREPKEKKKKYYGFPQCGSPPKNVWGSFPTPRPGRSSEGGGDGATLTQPCPDLAALAEGGPGRGARGSGKERERDGRPGVCVCGMERKVVGREGWVVWDGMIE